MAEITIDPNAPQVSESGSINPATSKVAVANFIGRLAQSSQANGGKFNSEQIAQLASRLAAHAGPQPANVDSGPTDTAPVSLDLGNLANAINTEESKIGIGTKFLALIKSWFGGESYDTAIAKQAFNKITPDQQTALLTLAFGTAIGLDGTGEVQNVQENVKLENVQAVLKFCQAVDVKLENVAKAISSISKFDEIECGLLSNLVKSGEYGATCLKKLIEKGMLTNLSISNGEAAKQIVLGLAKDGANGVNHANLKIKGPN
jgi:hypothetical protein